VNGDEEIASFMLYTL